MVSASRPSSFVGGGVAEDNCMMRIEAPYCSRQRVVNRHYEIRIYICEVLRRVCTNSNIFMTKSSGAVSFSSPPRKLMI